MTVLDIEGIEHVERTEPALDAQGWPVIAERQFILATRDTGYRNLPAAVAELIDNALQAGARHIHVFVREERELGVQSRGPARGRTAPSVISGHDGAAAVLARRIEIAVLDDGAGMDAGTLRTALQFGGSTHFNDRTGAGRFGMGLPNSSVSQARRVEVYTWQDGHEPIFSFLDVDQIAAGAMGAVPEPAPRALPAWITAALVMIARSHAGGPAGQDVTDPADLALQPSGTLVVWPTCDRLPFRKASTARAKLRAALGRLYRYVLRDGVQIYIDGSAVTPTDPLIEWGPVAEEFGAATPVGDELCYELKVPGDPARTSAVRVRFSLLPVSIWARLPIEVRRALGVIGGAGVSVVRARREIDYGWYFMGGKRKENYDDWWRCEVCFEPPLDEYFGVTHSKQGVTPHPWLLDIMAPDMEQMARTLNARIRGEFMRLAQRQHRSELAPFGAKDSCDLRHGTAPLSLTDGPRNLIATAARCEKLLPSIGPRLRTYRITQDAFDSGRFFKVHLERDTAVITLNTNHPFYAQLTAREDKATYQIECLLLAAARAELGLLERVSTRTAATGSHLVIPAEESALEQYINAWSDALAAFLSVRG